MKNLITHQQVIKDSSLFAAYMAQFVNEDIKKCVLASIGLETILNSTCKNLNDIPLKKWDDSSFYGLDIALLKESGNSYSMSIKVCILKAAARAIQQENKQ